MDLDWDLCVIGGGINGAGIARDAVGRGLSVILIESGDLACATSSASTKLIHGGLRYLEHFQFRLVAEGLQERERLLASAPHLVRPLDFILPHDRHVRPVWMIRAGLFLYDRLGRHHILPPSKKIDLQRHQAGEGLKPFYRKGFSYPDCRVDDSRLVVTIVRDAADKGAAVYTRTRCESLKPLESKGNQGWKIFLKDMNRGDVRSITARAVINATGPWGRRFLDENGLAGPETPNVRLVKGSHIVVPRLYDGTHACILQQPDGRVVFAIPYEGRFTLVGTTDVEEEGDPAHISIMPSETAYLCSAMGRAFRKPVSPGDVIWSYSGVRALPAFRAGKASEASREYRLHMRRDSGAPLLSVFGGKLTTWRSLSEQAVDKVMPFFPGRAGSWTADALLPGGDLPGGDPVAYAQTQRLIYPFLPEDLLVRWAHAYGTRMERIIGKASALADLGSHYGDHLYEAEIQYLMREEWACTVEDILWRRSKLGLHVSPKTIEALRRRCAAA
ncbi:MAG: glycerol-3-phosphate dehydrogenase [Alphaproteobacteria bacterium]|nr:glycerol-3-phosphate dehydrogenase [Alphaproteobacteria bacterium]